MKYVTAINIWDPTYSEAVRNGQFRLQSGQWIRLGEGGPLSRFHHANKYVITAFHGPNPAVATEKYLSYMQGIKEHRDWIATIKKKNQAQLELDI